MRRQRHTVMGVALGFALLSGVSLGAVQLPLAPVSGAGETVTPVFEGWYENPDGTLSLSFGYFNRNGEEVLEIPIGPDNFIAPGDPDQDQPTHFQPRRHWGVLVAKVPADYAGEKVVWTLKIRGETEGPRIFSSGRQMQVIGGHGSDVSEAIRSRRSGRSGWS